MKLLLKMVPPWRRLWLTTEEEREEGESFPSLLNRRTDVRRSESEGERVCQSDEERKERGEEEGGGWMMAAAGALGFVQRATRRATQPARKNLAAREAGGQAGRRQGREGISRGGSKL